MNEVAQAVGLAKGDEVYLTGESWDENLKGTAAVIAGVMVPPADGYEEPLPYIGTGQSRKFVYKLDDKDYTATKIVRTEGILPRPAAVSGNSENPIGVPRTSAPVSHTVDRMQRIAERKLIEKILAWRASGVGDDVGVIEEAVDKYEAAMEIIEEMKVEE